MTLRSATLTAAALLLAACSSQPAPPAGGAAANGQQPASTGPRITQFYLTKPSVPRGESALLCYGVENASSVWLEPPRRELSAAQSRCVDVAPEKTTTFKLIAQSRDGRQVEREAELAVAGSPPRIVTVNISDVSVRPGTNVTICYTVENARSVTVDPLHFAGPVPKGCTSDKPEKSTTYTVTAIGSDGQRDHETVTVSVK
jgi:hypothetical protein